MKPLAALLGCLMMAGCAQKCVPVFHVAYIHVPPRIVYHTRVRTIRVGRPCGPMPAAPRHWSRPEEEHYIAALTLYAAVCSARAAA
jgi:hypothetical protein